MLPPGRLLLQNRQGLLFRQGNSGKIALEIPVSLYIFNGLCFDMLDLWIYIERRVLEFLEVR